MSTLRGRFLLSHLLPILLILPLAGIILVILVETQVLLTDLTTDLTQRARLIATLTRRNPDIWQDEVTAARLLQEIETEIPGEIYFYLADGSLIAGSEAARVPQLSALELSQLQEGTLQIRTAYGLEEQKALVILPVQTVEVGIVGLVAVSETVSSASTIVGQMRTLIILTLLVEILLAAGVAVWLSGRLARPIAEVSAAVRDIAAGRTTQPLVEGGPDEIRNLAQSVNMLVERLLNLEEIRRRSLANIVHELGRPLGAIRSAIHVLHQGAGEDPSVREELLSGVENEIERMQPLLDDLVLLNGQVSEGPQWASRLNREMVDWHEWLPGVILPWRAAAIEKGLDWEIHMPADLPVLFMDPQRMGQSVGNLLSNAIKYTPAGGTIGLRVEVQPALVILQVSDSGPGIVPEEQEQVFAPFFRSDRNRRFPQGLGLGLTIAREIVNAHSGQLLLDSTPGAGSTFSIILPRAIDDRT